MKEKIAALLTENSFRKIFFVSAAVMFVIMMSVSHRYGICWDEKVQKDYGENTLKFYTSFGKDAGFLKDEKQIYMYGPFVEMVCAAAEKIFPGDPYNVRHSIIALFGFIAVLFTGLTARLLAGWRAGTLALFFIFLTPVFFGHSMFNSKDIPFATGYIVSVYFLICFIRELPKPSRKTILLLSIAIGISISIRIGGLLLFLYAGAAWLVKMIYSARSENQSFVERVKFIFMQSRFIVFVVAVGYVIGVISWPYALTNPFTHPLTALKSMSNYAFDSDDLFQSHWLHTAKDVPWYYIPLWIWITVPLFINIIVFFTPLLLIIKRKTVLNVNRGYAGLVGLTAFFPVFYIIIKHSNVYDGWRHAMFVYPSLVVICAVTWFALFRLLKSLPYRLGIGIILAGSIIQPAWWMIRNHPFEAFYFSPVIGGTDGAWKHYEIDYYGTSIRQAVEWIAENADTTGKDPVRVRCWYGELESKQHFIDKYPKLKLVFTSENSPDWDYSIVQPVQAKYDSMLLVNWPPAGKVYQAYADSTPIIAVVKNPHPGTNASTQQASIYTMTDLNALLAASLQYYNSGDYFSCIAACEKALTIDSTNIIAYNNKCSALNRLQLYPDAVEAGKKGLSFNPQYQLLVSNLNEALMNSTTKVDPVRTAASYVMLSLNYYYLGQYNRVIEYCGKALSYQPDNVTAYNNMCSAYNAMGKYKAAEDACSKGLQLDPKNTLLQNNLNEAKKHPGGSN